jgi:hypothetical protein
MSTRTFAASVCAVAAGAASALVICPGATADPVGGNCYRTPIGKFCYDNGRLTVPSTVSVADPCNVIPPQKPGPGCMIETAVPTRSPDGTWDLPIPGGGYTPATRQPTFPSGGPKAPSLPGLPNIGSITGSGGSQ